MAVLEEQGYLTQPHTSAGRIPTDKGYRFFVDTLRKREPSLVAADRGMVRQFFADAHGELESVLSRTSDLLISLTDCAAVVVGPNVDIARVRSTQLVDLSSHVVMVVAVMSNGVIEKRTVEVATELTPQIVRDASRRLAEAVVGKSLVEIQPETLDDDPLLNAAVEALRAASHTAEIIVGGASRVAAAFDAVEQVRDVLAILEEQIVVVSLIRDVLDRGMRVANRSGDRCRAFGRLFPRRGAVLSRGRDNRNDWCVGSYTHGLRAGTLGGSCGESPSWPCAERRAEMADHYQSLGVEPDATDEEIKRAYKKLARQYHPDLNPGDSSAETRFKELAAAYEVLADRDRRARYDRFGTDTPGAGDSFGGGLGDIFEAFFGSGTGFGGQGQGRASRPRGEDIEAHVDLDLEDVVFGGERDIKVRTAVRLRTLRWEWRCA